MLEAVWLSRSALLLATAALLCAAFIHVERVSAHDVEDTVSLGMLSAPGARTNFVSNQLELELAVAEHWTCGATFSFLHFQPTNDFHAHDATLFGLGVTFESDRYELELSGQLNPASTYFESSATPDDPREFVSENSMLGATLTGAYSTGGASAFEQRLEAAVGVTRYSSQQYVLFDPSAEPSATALARWQIMLTYTATLLQSTQLALAGSYWIYPVEQVGVSLSESIVAAGLPVEPLWLAVRPTLVQQLGPFELTLHAQYGRYVSGLGFGWSAGLKLALNVSDGLQLSAAGECLRGLYADGTRILIATLALAITAQL